MKKLWNLALLLCCALALSVSAMAASSGTCGDNLTWTLDGAGKLTISGTGAMEEYSDYDFVPWHDSCESVKTVVIESGVTSIGAQVFYGCRSLTSVTIPNSVTSIGSEAFYNCESLTSVTIPNSVKSIGGNAFSFCESLTSVTIPYNVTSIGDGAFSACTSLTQISVASGNANYSSENGILFSKDKSTLIQYPAGKTEISYTIPNSVTGIWGGAFFACSSLKSVTIPDSVTSIGDRAFSRCTSLKSVMIPDSVTVIREDVFSYCDGLASVTIGNGVTSIGDCAFYGCESLKSVTIPKGMKYIGYQAFDGCTSLADVYYAGSEAQWAAEVLITFYNAPLTSAAIHYNSTAATRGTCGDNLTWTLDDADTLTISGTGAMDDYLSTSGVPWYGSRDSIKSVVISGATSIGNGAFSGCASLASVTIPDGVKSIGSGAFYGCASLESVTIPDGVTSIGNEAFKGCASLESVTIPKGVTCIGNGVFTGCASLAQISVASGNENYSSENGILFTIDQSTLIRYPAGKKETSYTIPNSVTSIEDGAFSGCASLTQIGVESDSFVSENGILFTDDQSTLIQYPAGKKETSYTIPDSVTGVGKFAFSGCTSLESVTIPSSVTGVGDAAFDRCTSLADVHYTGSEEQWAAVSIGDDNDPLASAAIHYNSCGSCGDDLTWMLDDAGTLTISGTGAMEECFVPWHDSCESVKTVVIENGVTSIGEQAFYGCRSLTSVTIPNSVTSIGSEAFYNCEKLGSVTIPNSVKSIGWGAFSFCESLTSVTIPYNATSIGDGAFSGCASLASVTIPDSVTSIGDEAFKGCASLTGVTIPSSVTSIGKGPFSACTSLTQISVASGNANYSSENGILFSKDKKELVQYPAGKNETSYTIPNSVTSIGGCAFDGCTSIESVTIPDSVTSIGEGAFDGCTLLASVTIPDSMTSIGEGAFDGCTSLSDVYYTGSEEEWAAVRIDSGNDPLTSATIHYNSGVSVTASVSGTTLTYTVKNAPSGARLVVARYDGGKMTFVQTVGLTGSRNGSLTLGGSGDMCRLMLVDGTTFAPLCPAKTVSVP